MAMSGLTQKCSRVQLSHTTLTGTRLLARQVQAACDRLLAVAPNAPGYCIRSADRSASVGSYSPWNCCTAPLAVLNKLRARAECP